MADVAVERQKAKSKGFLALGVPVGAVLTYRKDAAVTCTVVDEKNKVEYNGKVYPISGLAKELMQCPISGYHAFKYNGVLLAKLGDSAPEGPKEIPVKPADVAQGATQIVSSPTSQTVPLPRPQDVPVKPPAGNSGDIPNIDPLT